MTNVNDVQAHKLIEKIAKDLKENKKLTAPDFTLYVKTGSHRERAPQDPDWWFIRMASILRKIYISGRVNVNSLRTYYGGKKNRGVRPSKFRRAGGKIIRVCLQDLEKLGFVKIDSEKTGRVLTDKGVSYLDKIASTLKPKESAKKTKETTKEVKKEDPKKEKPKASEEKPKPKKDDIKENKTK